ncbi:tetraacyldisaccharide 4'-kinase [Veronia nyctiphanis]|uniref:Tetraacyldisaccharide 4'-kinase n=1 Tax=Veronia nyctiphanis TaxID=1278244 RepID=A0A4Q0YNJ5_9GAMM|nr:tetraacyldisaccharide 4'-kinase [Veronia nyctiphanis]RXJ72436.1 tetraacyldisaccharide 4'-kinase [Veronia nyctiphanis]
MVEKIWFDKHPLGWVLSPLLWPLSKLFAHIAAGRRQRFLANSSDVYRAPVPIVVVGNITVGGNGKTPVVVWLVEQLKAKGLNPGVVSRGYGGKAPQYPYVLDESSSAKEAGDEPVLIAKRTGVPVSVSPIRSEAIKSLLPLGVDIIVTDDGLQHYKMDRDIEFAVIDGNRRFGNGHAMPMGPLREPRSRLKDVDFVICNGGHPEKTEISMSLVASKAINLLTRQQAHVTELGELVAIAGIGHPERFFNTLNELGNPAQTAHGFADHKSFEMSELASLTNDNQQLIMTEKDAVKCQSYVKDNQIGNWWYVPVDAHLPNVAAETIINKIMKVKETYGSSTA